MEELKDLFDAIIRRRSLIFRILAVFIGLAVIYNFLASPVYQATVSIKVNPKGVNETTGAKGNYPEDQNLKMQTAAEIVKSRTVLEGVINKIFEDVPEEQRPPYTYLSGSIGVGPIKGTNLLNISVKADSPDEAQKVANSLVEVFLKRMTELAQAEGRETRLFIGARLEEAKQNLDKAEKAMTAYKKEKKTITISDQTKNFMERQGALKRMEVDNQLAVNSANAKAANVQGQMDRQSPGFIAENPLIQTYKLKLAEQEAELVLAKSNMSDRHPKVIGLKAAIAETRDKLGAEMDRVVRAEASSSNPVYQSMIQSKIQAETELAVALAQQQGLQNAKAQADNELKTIPEKEQGLARLIRDYTVAEEAYMTLAKRYEQARIDEVMQPSDVQVVDMASRPEYPIQPRKAQNILMAIILGLMVGVGSAFVLDYFRKTVNTVADVRHLGLRVIGSIPSRRLYNTSKKQSLWQRLTGLLKPKSRGVNYDG